MLTRLGFVVHNEGGVLVQGAKVVVRVPRTDRLRLLDEPPTEPVGPLQISPQRPLSNTRIHERGDHCELVALIGKVQPSASAWSDAFWIGSPSDQTLQLEAVLYADNISRPVKASFDVHINVENGWLEYEDDEA